MIEGVEIKGGATEFEAAVIAIVLDHVQREEEAARQGRRSGGPGLPAWVRAISAPPEERRLISPDRP
jgi:hypothetical protein